MTKLGAVEARDTWWAASWSVHALDEANSAVALAAH
jgi:hypothetical protein